MQTPKIRHQSITSYVKNGATILNTIFLILHLGFGLFFKSYNATILFYYNMISIAVFLVGYILLYFNCSNLYSLISNLEVYTFMTICTICLGWGYGFQQYCIIFVVSLLFTDYSIGEENKINKVTIFSIILIILTYFVLRIWTYFVPYVYLLESNSPEHIFFYINSILAFAFLIAYSFFYSQTVFRLQKALVDVATKDALTGLYNRRKMQDLLSAMSEVLASTGNNICIAMIDIDNFKKINDTYGHDIGDEVLKKLAEILLEKSRKEESFCSCRWGGEEFLIFYRTDELDKEQLIQEFENIRQQISEQTVVYNEDEIHFTITTGLSFYQDNISITQMIKQADDNLYIGKNSGKNVVIY